MIPQIKYQNLAAETLEDSLDLAGNLEVLGIADPHQAWTLVTECEGEMYSIDFIGGCPVSRS